MFSNYEKYPYFTSRPAERHFQTPIDEYPIHTAINKNLPNISEVILANKDEINTFNEEGYTPLHLAVIGNKPEIVTLLLQCDDLDINETVESKAVMKYERKSALHIAINMQHIKIIEQLLSDQRIDVRAKCSHYTAFHLAAVNIPCSYNPNQIVIMKMLLAHKDNTVNLINDWDRSGYSPLHDVIQIIGARLDNEEHTNRVFNLTMSAKDIKVNTCTDDMFGRNTPLHEAAATGSLHFVTALLAHKDIEIKRNLKGLSPQDKASKHPLVLDAFTRYLADPDEFKKQYKIEQSHNEIRKSARILSQGKKTGLFEPIPNDVVNLIAAFTRDHEVHTENEALKISNEFMGKKI